MSVLREAITNVARHARARRVAVEVQAGGSELRLVVSDDGEGMPADAVHSGLRNARERAEDLGGSLELGPDGSRGTRFVWRVPLV